MTVDDREDVPDLPVVALVEWPTAGFDVASARRLAGEAAQVFRRMPGLLDVRFFGDFDSQTHYYLLTWRDRAALDAYIGSEAMFTNRALAEPFVAGKVSRRIFVDYSPRAG